MQKDYNLGESSVGPSPGMVRPGTGNLASTNVGRNEELASSVGDEDEDDKYLASMTATASGQQEQIDFVKRLTDKYLKKG